MGFLENFGLGRNKGNNPEDRLKMLERTRQEEIAKEAQKAKKRQWERAKLDAEGRHGEFIDMPTAPLVSGMQGGSPAEDPYGRVARTKLERLEVGLPVTDAELQGTGAVNPSAIGDARIQRGTSEEEAASPESGFVLSPEMDAYLQTQVTEEAAAREARDRDPKPGVEN